MSLAMQRIRPYQRSIIAFVALMLLAGVAESFPVPMTFGLDVRFGSVFLIFAFCLLGAVPGLLAALGVSLYLVVVGEQSPTVFLLAAEIAFLCFYRGTRQTGLVKRDLQFWLLVAAPAMLALYFAVRRQIDSGIVLTVCKLAVNGTFNALLADMMLTYLPLRRRFAPRGAASAGVSLQTVLFHLATAAAMIPFVLLMITNSFFQLNDIMRKADQRASAAAFYVADMLKAQAPREPDELDMYALAGRGRLAGVAVSVLDERGRTLVSSAAGQPEPEGERYRLDDESFLVFPEQRPLFETDKWRGAAFVRQTGVDSLPYQVQARVPLATITADLFAMQTANYAGILTFVVLVTLLTSYASNYIAGGIRRLASMTSGLPERLRKRERLEWPSSGVAEVRSLVANFTGMSDIVSGMLDESDRLNRSLREQADRLLASEAGLQTLAYNDVLTGLPNRQFFTKHLNDLIARRESGEGAAGRERPIGVLFMDIDRFKQVNDTLGHAAGDLLLQSFAARLKKLQDRHIICRLGGDEFVVVMDGADRQQMTATAERIILAFAEPLLLQEQELYVNASIGISVFPEDGSHPDEIVKNADTAMYAAKEAGGRRIEFFAGQMQERLDERLKLENRLYKALLQEEFELYYQPKIGAASGETIGVEAFIRWRQPEMGIVPPDKFIPLAEETGVIHPLGEWVLRTACEQNRRWQLAGLPAMVVAVNMSARQFEHPNLAAMVGSIIEETGLDPRWLEIEVTEGSLFRNQDAVVEVLNRLKAMGVGLSIDDFGTGYSSLSQLKHLPLYALKIDRVFISHIDRDPENASIVTAVTQLAHSMNLRVVAEGVETRSEFDFLRDIGCDEIQGYYFSRPLPQHLLEEWLAERQAAREAAPGSEQSR